jgi:hypothetical protein
MKHKKQNLLIDQSLMEHQYLIILHLLLLKTLMDHLHKTLMPHLRIETVLKNTKLKRYIIPTMI